MLMPAPAGHAKCETTPLPREGRSWPGRDVPALLFLLMPLVVASVAVVLMTNVMHASATNRRRSEVVAGMRVAAERINDQRDDGDLRLVPDRAAIAAEVACFDHALRTLEPTPRAGLLKRTGGSGLSVARDLGSVRVLWAGVRPNLVAWSRGDQAAVTALAPGASRLLVATESLARDADRADEAAERGHLRLIGALLLLQILGLLAGAAAKMSDIRKLRRHEHEVANLSLITEHTGSAIVLCGRDGRARWANEAFLRTTGWREAEIAGRPALELLCAQGGSRDGFAELGAAMAQALEHHGDLELRRRDGVSYHAELELVPLHDDSSAVHHLALVFTDVTERVSATLALQESESQFRSALAAISEGFLLLDAEGAILQSNAAAQAIFGLAPDRITGRLAADPRWQTVREDGSSFPGDELPVAITLHTGEPQRDVVMGIVTPAGERRWISVSTSPFRLAGGGRQGVVATFSDVTARRRTEEDLRLLTSVVADSPTMVMITDTDDRLEYVNGAFEKRTGWTSDEVRGRTPEFMLNERTRPETWAELMSTLEAGGAWRGEVYNTTRAGETWLAVSQVFVLRGAGGGVSHHVAMLQDITEQRRREEELAQAREASLAAARAKNEFLQNMSHELRTPLNGILGVSELLLHTPLEPEQRADVLQMRRSAGDLLTVINHLFDFARIESGGVARESVPFRLHGCIAEVEASLAADAEARGLRWRVEVSDGLPDVRMGDPGALRQVLLCLASNAVKFTERGDVVLRVLAEPEAGGRPRVRFEMRDSGIGIPAERQVEIFEAFSQVDGSSTRKYGGIGLGLALATRLVRQMGGSLDVSSERSEGSTFSFVIPLDAAPDDVARTLESAAASPPVVPPPAGRRVLLVGAAAPGRHSTVAVLELAGDIADVAAAADGPEAAALALSRAGSEGRPYRALVLDQRDGGLDGFAFFVQLRDAAPGALPPTLLFTSAGERGDAARCRELGIAGYLSSPAGDHDLIEALRHLRPATADAAPLVTRHLLREECTRRRALVVDDNAVNRKVASRLLERSGYEVATAVHGGDAVEQFRQGGWDIVLMDVQMPEMDGLEATRRIRELECEGGLPRTPILAVTAHTLDSDRRAVFEAGMDELVPKPIVADHLLATMQRFLADAPIASTGTSAPPAIEDVIDWRDALNRMDGDADVLEQLLRIFLMDSTNIMRRLEDARESGDAVQLERAAHGLKGASGTISARHVAPLARDVEELARAGRMNEARDRFDDLRREMQRLVDALEALPPPARQEDAA